MPTRNFACDLAGTGTRLDQYRCRVNVLVAANPEEGVYVRQRLLPATGQALARVTASASLLLLLAADAQVEPLPNIGLNDRWDSWGTPVQRNALLNRLEARGYDVTGIVNSTLFRVLVRRMGRRFDPDFDEDRF